MLRLAPQLAALAHCALLLLGVAKGRIGGRQQPLEGVRSSHTRRAVYEWVSCALPQTGQAGGRQQHRGCRHAGGASPRAAAGEACQLCRLLGQCKHSWVCGNAWQVLPPSWLPNCLPAAGQPHSIRSAHEPWGLHLAPSSVQAQEAVAEVASREKELEAEAEAAARQVGGTCCTLHRLRTSVLLSRSMMDTVVPCLSHSLGFAQGHPTRPPSAVQGAGR